MAASLENANPVLTLLRVASQTGCSRSSAGVSHSTSQSSSSRAVLGRSMSIMLRNLAGRELRLELDPSSTVQALQSHVAEYLGVPTLCQRLILESTGHMLDDFGTVDKRLGELQTCVTGGPIDRVQPNGDLALTVVVTLDGVRKAIGNGSDAQCLCAVHALEEIVEQDSGHATAAMDVLVQSMPQLPNRLRHKASTIIAGAAHTGNHHAVDVAIALVEDVDSQVRCAVVDGLRAQVQSGNGKASLAVAKSLYDDSLEVRQRALDTIARVAWGGDQSALAVTSDALDMASAIHGARQMAMFDFQALRKSARAKQSLRPHW